MKFFNILVLVLISGFFRAQSLANYSSSRNTSVTYNSIASTGNSFSSWRNSTSNTQDDNRSDFTNIGFDFWYNGVRYTQFCVSTNGFLDFSSSTDDGGPQADDFGYNNAAFTTANAANATRPAIAPFYDDLTAQGGTAALGNSLKYLVTGSAPNRTLTVEWINMAVYQNTSPSLNFQVQLVESTGVVIINYGTMTAGTNVFSYSMGMNGPTVSNTPTSAQLKMLQTVNANSFSNTVQNNLSTMPTANSQYVFTPLVPTTASGSLSFTGITQTGMTLNWTNWASNEVGYVIYNSTDNINFDFVVQSAVNATTTAITGLLPSTTYYWKLYAVTEGYLSAAINGTQATLAAGNKTSTTTGNWNTAATWSPTGVPTSADNVYIANGHTVTINTNGVCNNLTVGQGSSGYLQFSGTSRTLGVNNNITVNSNATFLVNTSSNVTHSLTVEGNITNNGTVNFATDANSFADVFFTRDGNQTLSGTGATNTYNNISVTLGSADHILEISSSNFSAASNFLTLNSGLLKISTGNAVSVTPFTGATTISANSGLWLNASNLTVNTSAGVTLYGGITISNGTLNIGNAQDEDILSNGGSIVINNGAMNIAGKLDASSINNTCDFNINGGTLTVPSFGSTNTGIAPFHIAGAGSQCNMTGGTIIIPRSGGSGTQNLGFTNTGTSGAIVTGGTLQIGSSASPTGQTIDINTDSPVNNLLVNSANVSARLNTNALDVVSNITISSGTLNANNLGLSLGGNWSSAATFSPGTGTVTFDGSSTQSISKTGGETFYTLLFTGAGVKTFSTPVTSNANFSISSGSSVDVSTSNHSLTVKGNFINNGTFTARTGSVILNGTTAQNIGGSTTTDFYNLNLNNSAGASLSHAENLKGTLTLSGGTFSANSQVFTMISDASGTARIAQITGTGDYNGNVTAQRYAPGGTTGWAFLGSPLSSALTLNDWDDNIYISCPTCPDGSAGGFLSVYTYSEAATGAFDSPGSYIPLSTINDAITSGKGYWVYLGNGPSTTSGITLDLTGTPRKSAYSIPLTYSNYGSATNDGWNLICNPYPSAISWASLRGSTSNVDNAIYVYNADLNSGSGGFATYVNGISSPAVASGGVGDNIPMGQGFYVHSTGATALSAQESNKVANDPTFLKPASSSALTSLTRISLKGAITGNDETVLYFQTNATDNFDDAYDSYKMPGQDPYAPIITLEKGGKTFQVNGVAPVSGNFSMPLKTLTGYSGTYTISASDINSFPKGACITLYDKFTSTTTDLKTSDYVFTLEDTTSVARFDLNIILNALSSSTSFTQPSCSQPSGGKVIAVGNNAGPWNYYWKINNVTVQTSLNKSGADSLVNLNQGIVSLEMNTSGSCDNFETDFTINGQIPVQAHFNSVDTVYLNTSGLVQFTNTSVNAMYNTWDFGSNTGMSQAISPSFTYTSEGVYTVKLICVSNSGCMDSTFKTLVVLSEPVGLNKESRITTNWILKNLGNGDYILSHVNPENHSYSFDLYDIQGKLIRSYGESDAGKLELNIRLESPGLYFLNLRSDKEQHSIKLVR